MTRLGGVILAVEIGILVVAIIGFYVAWRGLQKQTDAIGVAAIMEINSSLMSVLPPYMDVYFALKDENADEVADCRTEQRSEFYLGNFADLSVAAETLVEKGVISESMKDVVQGHLVRPLRAHVCNQICEAWNPTCTSDFIGSLEAMDFRKCPCFSSLPDS